MARLGAFVFTTLNGFLHGPQGDIRWHRHGAEEAAFSEEGANSGNTLLFGRVTYEMMAGFWPTPAARQSMPVVAQGMNQAEKIVFSRTLKKAEWNNTRVVGEKMAEEIQKLKQTSGKDLVLLGSGSILSQLTDAGLIDQYQVMVDPVALGEGTPLFQGIQKKLDLQLVDSKIFKSGVVLLTYRPMERP